MERSAVQKHVPLRIGLGVAVSLLVTVTVAAITGITFFNTRASILEQTNERVDALLRELSGRVAAHMAAAVPSIEVARAMLRDSLVPNDPDALARQFTLVLRNNPSFSWMSYSDEAGNFTGAYRAPDATLHVSQSTYSATRSELHEYLVSETGQWTPTIRQSNYGYDPRADRFYGPAKSARTRVWIGPYVFFDEGVPGITCALPYIDASGVVRGVFTIDFNLNALSRFVQALPFGQHGRVFILTADGTIIADPTLRLVQTTGQGSRGTLLTVANVNAPVIPKWFDAWKKNASGSTNAHFLLDIGNQRYVAGSRVVEFDRNVSWVVGAAAPESDFLGLLSRIRTVAVVVLAAALAFGVLVSIVLARRIAAPLSSLATEMTQVGDFVLTDRAHLRTRFREVALMDRALLSMKGSLRSFAYYVPTELVRTLLASGQEARLEGHTEELTVFFADIAGFTSMAESETPDDLVRHLARYFDELSRIISASGGTIDKFIGDAVMAFWGAPTPAPDHAARGCEAAIRIQRALASVRASAGSSWLAGLHARVGVASGDVLVGNVGTPDRFNYTVMGDTANLASRLESLNKLYGTPILVSEATYAAARERIVARPVDLVQVKGKHLGVTVYEPLCLATDEDPEARRIADLSEQAFAAYRARRFQEAAETFARLRSIRADDRAASVLEARCRAYVSSPPPENWSGVHVATEK
jgi:adenylate cyclase